MLNLIAGGGRVLAIFIWKTINVIYILIKKYSQNSSKKRDCYSIAALVKRYKTIISLLEDYWLFIEEDSKYILYDAYLKMDMPKQANVMKREINNFEQVEIRMKRNIDLNIEA